VQLALFILASTAAAIASLVATVFVPSAFWVACGFRTTAGVANQLSPPSEGPCRRSRHPVAVGRAIFRLLVDRPVHELYAYGVGVTATGVVLAAARFLVKLVLALRWSPRELLASLRTVGAPFWFGCAMAGNAAADEASDALIGLDVVSWAECCTLL